MLLWRVVRKTITWNYRTNCLRSRAGCINKLRLNKRPSKMGRATSKPNKGTLRLCTKKRQMATQKKKVRHKVQKTAKPPTMTQKKRKKKLSSCLMQKRKTKTSTSSSRRKSWLK